jgi:hypothetical protein
MREFNAHAARIGILLFCMVLLNVLSSACNRKPQNAGTPVTTSSSNVSQGGHPALQFDYKRTSEILIAKADPNSGDRWAARIQRDGIPSPENEELWTIQMGPDSIASGDRKAHGGFILHLLDTIRTLQVSEAPVSGSAESFGLSAPLFILRWRVAEQRTSVAAQPSTGTVRAQVFKEYEVRLGGPVKNQDGSFQGLYASLGGMPNKVFIVQGALLRMLDMITSFQTLRLPTVLTVTSDDVDELEIRRPSSKIAIYAQRESGKWVDAKHKPIAGDIDALLDQLTHMRVLQFIDDAAELKKLEARLAKSPAQEITFKDRHGKANVLKVYSTSNGEKVYATFSTRKRQNPDGLAIFEVYPEVLTALASLKQN